MGISAERGALWVGRPRLTHGSASGGARMPKGEITIRIGYLPLFRGAEKQNGKMGKSKIMIHARVRVAPSCVPRLS